MASNTRVCFGGTQDAGFYNDWNMKNLGRSGNCFLLSAGCKKTLMSVHADKLEMMVAAQCVVP